MKNKIFVGLAIVLIVALIIIAVFGFNVDLSYRSYNLIDVKIGQDFKISDVEQIAKEVFTKQNVEVQKAGVYSDNVVIKVSSNISDEQKNTLNTKINEKLGINNNVDDIKINYIPSYRLRDILKSYVGPLAIATLAVLVYMAIRYRKIGVVKVLSQVIILSVIAEALFMAVIAITRYPINRLVMPSAILIFMLIITVLTGMFEKQKGLQEK